MNPKIENLLQISVQADEVRDSVPDMNAGYNSQGRTWEIIVKATESLHEIKGKYGNAVFTQLLCGYWIITASIEDIERLANEPDVIFIEKPKALYLELYAAKSEACVNTAKSQATSYGGVTGRGVLVAIIDSGIDISDREFLNSNGTTRIRNLWDQGTGIVYSQDEINEILEGNKRLISDYLPAADSTGHGNSVAVIACGNSGVASESDIIVVKLGNAGGDSFVRTTQLMRGLDYCIRKAIEYKQPIAVNISYGGTYGNHEGNSVFEMFIDDCCGVYKCSICIGAGNEGEGRTHFSGKLDAGIVQYVEIAIGEYETQISIQIWKRAIDDVLVELISPTGQIIVISDRNADVVKNQMGEIKIVSRAYGPGPFYMEEEIYAAMAATNGYITAGIWKLRFLPLKILDGQFNIWLPPVSTLSNSTGFLKPSPEYTYTIPSTSRRAICVGANGRYPGSAAIFSGRGVNVKSGLILYAKPDITAPGVNISIPGAEERYVTGTSFAAPMVTGAAAMLMEWGIVKGNDPYMYGEKIKAYLIEGATRNGNVWPDSAKGWGELCVASSIQAINSFNT